MQLELAPGSELQFGKCQLVIGLISKSQYYIGDGEKRDNQGNRLRKRDAAQLCFVIKSGKQHKDQGL